MSHPHRFYVPDLAAEPGRIALPPAEAHHALHVLRVREGDAATVFDGTGRFAHGRIWRTSKREVEFEAESIEREDEGGPRLVLAQAWLNHERNIETIIRRGTELGVAGFVFFRGAHSERAPKIREKWTRYAIESCKQCGRNRLPVFEVAASLEAVITGRHSRVLVATQAVGAHPIPEGTRGDESVLLIVGPEGDFSAAELEHALEAGAVPISLGKYTLRSEVAATVAIALVQYRLEKLV